MTSTTTTTTNQTSNAPPPGSVEASLLVGQPPGTVIKCVTAQVIQTIQGPRIVLQGLQGADFTPQQLVMVQQQVKQQLLKGSIIHVIYVFNIISIFIMYIFCSPSCNRETRSFRTY